MMQAKKEDKKMLALLDQTYAPITADETEAVIAKKAAERLAAVAEADQDITVHVEGVAKIAVPLPAKAVKMMLTILLAMAERKPVSMIPHEAELTTKQVADFLNVSRPYVCKIIDEGKLKARLVNRHRRVKFSDILAYEKSSQNDRYEALAEMAEETRKLGLE
ncbi:helix-turn-helix domain-containing protein [Mesorhizobium sp. M0222]|uniref:helix-turn-helix domain-containing protein n=1 Tax=unclassified Mesorhizobium TaxID=325217 RepID=UPI0003CF2AA4|nr:helix-turn-helix domain-containing protein [Mesorhizobium sp. LSHC414A00]ESX70754.1 excisionase [Mesorhizobium sp. LSHC414A00]